MRFGAPSQAKAMRAWELRSWTMPSPESSQGRGKAAPGLSRRAPGAAGSGSRASGAEPGFSSRKQGPGSVWSRAHRASRSSGAQASTEAQKGGYGLVVLDWMLPDKDGLVVCEELRRAGVSSPILMLTGRGETRDRVQGLDAGADDYMVKPFEVEELVARVRALLRRAAPAAEARLRRGPLEIDRMGQKVSAGGVQIALTSREFALLVHLAQHTERRLPASHSAWWNHVYP